MLGAAMLSQDALLEALQLVRADDFYNKAHREIFEAISDLNAKNVPVDTLTVSEELKKRGTLETVGGRLYVSDLSMAVPSVSNVAQYANIVAEKALLRNLIGVGNDILEQSYSASLPAEEVLNEAEGSIFRLSQTKQSRDYSPIKEVLLEDIALIEKAERIDGTVTGVTSGFKDLDNILFGFQKSDLIILAARPAMGKTAFALNVAQKAALKGGASVIVFSLEMAAEQLGQRLLAMESKIDATKLRTGKLSRADWDDINIALDNLSGAKIFIDDTPGVSVMEIRNKCRRLKAEKGLDLIIIDYLQLMTAQGRVESRQQEISTLTRQLKMLAREIDCPVIVLSQLSRAPEQRTEHRPQLSDLRESGSIEQDADIVLFLYREEVYNKQAERPGICEVIIAKHRAGQIGSIELTWQEKYTRFVDISRTGK